MKSQLSTAAKCTVSKSQARPLIVEWESSDRASLEAAARRGAVVVRYSGCSMEILPFCKAQIKYSYQAVTRKQDKVKITNSDELFTHIPMGAAKFEGQLQQSGELNVALTIVGQYVIDNADVRLGDLKGRGCDKATHVVSAITTGAFNFYAGADAAAGASAGVFTASIGGKAKSGQQSLNRDGDEKACLQSTDADPRPPQGCGAMLRLEVMSLETGETPKTTTTAVVHPVESAVPTASVTTPSVSSTTEPSVPPEVPSVVPSVSSEPSPVVASAPSVVAKSVDLPKNEPSSDNKKEPEKKTPSLSIDVSASLHADSKGIGPQALMIGGFALGAAGLIFGGVTGGLTLSKGASLREQCSANGACPASKQDDVDKLKMYGNLSTVGFAVGAVGIAAGAVGLVWKITSKKKTTAWIQPTVGLGTMGVMGKF